MTKLSKRTWKLLGFSRARSKRKKYRAIFRNRRGDLRALEFGAIRSDGVPYQQYHDSTGLKLYSKYDHGSLDRRHRYRARHRRWYNPSFWSPAYLSWVYLW